MMKEHENSFTSKAIDEQTERWSSDLSQDEHHLIQALYTSSQTYAQENEQSLGRIWERFVQRQGHPALLQETQHEQPESERFLRKGKAMREDNYWGTGFSISDSLPVKRPRRALWRTLSIVAAVAVVLVTIVSWVLLSSALRQSTVHNGLTTQVGATQKELSSGTLLCSFSDNATGYPVPIQPTLDWSSSGQIAVTYHNLMTASAQDCATKSANLLPQAQQATWSPDGKSLLALTGGKAEVLDASTGNVIASFQGNESGDTVEQSVWSSDGTIVSAIQTAGAKTGNLATSGTAGPILIQIWNANTGAFIRTALTLNPGEQLLGLNVGMLPISPDGKHVAVQQANGGDVEIWNIASGKLVNSLPYHQSANLVSVSALTWSPDGAYLALGLPSTPEVQIWSVATGQLTTSFKDSADLMHVIGALSWSPDGKYLAESSSALHIWDVKAQKIVATFGNIDKTAFITTLAWSTDGTMLASTTNPVAAIGQPTLLQNTVNVWKLS